MTERFTRRTEIAVPAEEVFRWHTRPGAFERLLPPWEDVQVVDRSGDLRDGEVTLRTRLGPLPLTWVARHQDYVEGRRFRDVQVRGPFARWEHTHSVEPLGGGGSILEDRVEYALPLGSLGRLLGGRLVRRQLQRTFEYRQRTTGADLVAHARWKGRSPMRILISGSSGFVGSALLPFLTTGGHQVVRLVRHDAGPEEVGWDPAGGIRDADRLGDVDAVVHLAGENISAGRWTAERKERIRSSRGPATRRIAEALAGLPRPPKVLVCASAIGFYGDRGDEILNEESTPGEGFLAQVCREWEAATLPAAEAGIRVVNARFGVILSPGGGALARMLLPFRLGLGGRVGDGRQQMSWISLDDAVGAILHALGTDELRGPVNVVAGAVRNAEFTRALGRVLGRPTIFPMPGFAARLAFGEMADELLLASARVEPARLLETGYRFRHPDLDGALRHLLGRS